MLIHEVLSPDCDRKNTRLRGHTTAAEAARIAAGSRGRRLIMTHIDSPYHFDQQPLIDEARRIYDGPISVAGDLYQVAIRIIAFRPSLKT